MIYQLDPAFSFTKPQVATAKNPFVVFANIDYKPGTAETSLQYWEKVATTSENEETGTLSYALCKENSNLDRLHTVEVYESEQYLWEVHAKSEAIATSVQNTKDIRAGLNRAFLKVVGGFFHRE